MSARSAGAYVIKDGRVRWRPAVDGDCLFAILVAVAYLFAQAGRTGDRVQPTARRHAP